jgi:hypothetical protein
LRERKTGQSNAEESVECSTVSSFPTCLAEYTNDRHGAIPQEVMDSLNLDKSRREQVEHYLAITRYTMFKDREDNDADGLRWDRVKWSDVADWDVPNSEQ